MKRSEANEMRRAIENGAKSLSDKEVSLTPDVLPRMRYKGAAIEAGTRINWNGKVKSAAVTLWDREDSNPDNAPDLWNDINYRKGIRVIPEHILVTAPFSEGEEGIDDNDIVWVSKYNNNVYTPVQYEANWYKKEAGA
jgi:hypothetical protein